MRIAIAHPALGSEGIDEAFARAARAGADGVEMHYASPAMATALTGGDHAAALRAAAKDAGVDACALCLDCLRGEPALIGRAEMVERTQEFLGRAIAAAAEVDAAMLVLPFYGKNMIETEQELSRALDALLDAVETAEEAGVTLVIETTLAFHQQEFLLSHLGSSQAVGVACNTAVAEARKLDAPTGLRQLGPGGLSLVRLRDVRLAAGQPPDFDVALGSGDVDFPGVARALKAIGYEGWVVVDPPLADGTDPLPAATDAIAFARSTLLPAAAR